jgi:hypothetical protein
MKPEINSSLVTQLLLRQQIMTAYSFALLLLLLLQL